jgi:HK97 family phage prohead protease
MTTAKSKTKQPQLETRTTAELRAGSEEGVIEGYIAVWNTVDDYRSTFERGAFEETIRQRGDQVKLYYNHRELVGRSLEVREDDHGVFVRGRLTQGVQRAKEVLEFVKDGTLTGLSFGFRVLRETVRDGVRVIQAVDLFEYGPVDFPANDSALITGVRAARIMAEAGEDVEFPEEDGDEDSEAHRPGVESREESRAESFSETFNDQDLRARGYRLLRALDETLDDIWWSTSSGNEDHLAKLDAALAEFHAAYMEWASAYMARFWTSEARSSPVHDSPLAKAFAPVLEGVTPDQLATTTPLTLDEVRQLRRGVPIQDHAKLGGFSEEVRAAHRRARAESVESMFARVRDMTPAERRRLSALLQTSGDGRGAQDGLEHRASSPEGETCAQAVAYLRDYRASLTKGASRNA